MVRTPYEKALDALKEIMISFDDDQHFSGSLWREFLFKHVSSAVPNQKHATEMLLSKGIISKAEQDGFIVHLDGVFPKRKLVKKESVL